MSRMGDGGFSAALKEIRSLIKDVAEDVTAIRAKLNSFDPDQQHDFSPDDGDHRWPGLKNIQINKDMYPWNDDNTTTTADVHEEEQ